MCKKLMILAFALMMALALGTGFIYAEEGDEEITDEVFTLEANGYSLQYTIDQAKNEVYINGYTGQPVDVVIPDEIEGKPVVGVGGGKPEGSDFK